MYQSKNKAEWDAKTVAPGLKRFPEREPVFRNSSGIEVKRLYDPEDLADMDYSQELGYPGEYPFTRGVQPTLYRGRIWTMRQYAGFASAEESNRRYRYLMEQGQTGLSVAFDLPSQIGYDSDHPRAQGEVGKVGVPICTLKDMEILLDSIPLDKVSTSMTINSTAFIMLAMYEALARKQGVEPAKLNGTIQNDVLKEYVARGTYIFPPRPSMRITTDIFQYCSQNLPQWNTISVSGYHMREAGASAAQELAFTLANGIAYVKAAIETGQQVDNFAPRVSFFFASHNNLLEEVAKFRAARRLWARIMRERFKAQDPRSCMLRFHTQTLGSTLTAQQPDNNVIRVAVQCLAAILGGSQSLHACSKDEAMALPSEEAVQLSLRTQQVLAYESGVADTVDPLGGSYYLESLTTALEQEAQRYIDKIDSLGGAVAAIEQGYMQREIQENAYRLQRDIEMGKYVVVGVNKFVAPYPKLEGLLRIDPATTQKHLDRLGRVKGERDQRKVASALKRLEDAARGQDNIMPPTLEAVEAYASVGEVCDVLRRVFGEQREFLVF